MTHFWMLYATITTAGGVGGEGGWSSRCKSLGCRTGHCTADGRAAGSFGAAAVRRPWQRRTPTMRPLRPQPEGFSRCCGQARIERRTTAPSHWRRGARGVITTKNIFTLHAVMQRVPDISFGPEWFSLLVLSHRLKLLRSKTDVWGTLHFFFKLLYEYDQVSNFLFSWMCVTERGRGRQHIQASHQRQWSPCLCCTPSICSEGC